MSAIIIEQSQDETKLAFEVNSNATIGRIRLTRAKVASRATEEELKPPIAVVFNIESRHVSTPANVMRLEIAFRMMGTEEKEEGKKATPEEKPDLKESEPVVLVECAYEVDYVLREGFSITPEHVKAFKDGNAIFNIWPYFREYLQNTLQRMGLPPLAAPFLRLQVKPKPHKRGKPERETERRLLKQGRP